MEISLYQSEQSGIETDPKLPWATVCEIHNACVCHYDLATAKRCMAQPSIWCEECAKIVEKKKQAKEVKEKKAAYRRVLALSANLSIFKKDPPRIRKHWSMQSVLDRI
jgi:hypothetical protein